MNLQAGVVDGHFRGGRLGEVQYQVDGVSVNNAYDNKSSSAARPLAARGGAGDQRHVRRRVRPGHERRGERGAASAAATRFAVGRRGLTGGFVYSRQRRAAARADDYDVPPGRHAELPAHAVSGPTPLRRPTFLANVRRYVLDDCVYGDGGSSPDRQSTTARTKVASPDGDGADVPLGTRTSGRAWLKVSNRSIKNMEFGYQAIFNVIDGQRRDWAFRYDARRALEAAHLLDRARARVDAHARARSRFYNVERAPELLRLPRHGATTTSTTRATTRPGRSCTAITGYDNGAYDPGRGLHALPPRTRTRSRSRASFVSQLSQSTSSSSAASTSCRASQFGAPGYLVSPRSSRAAALVRHVDEPPDDPAARELPPGVRRRRYAQDQSEWNDLMLRGGLRFDCSTRARRCRATSRTRRNTIAGVPAVARRSRPRTS